MKLLFYARLFMSIGVKNYYNLAILAKVTVDNFGISF